MHTLVFFSTIEEDQSYALNIRFYMN